LVEPCECDFLSDEENRDVAPGAGLAVESAPRIVQSGPQSAGCIDPAGSQTEF